MYACAGPPDEYVALLKTRQAGKRYLKDWHFVHAFQDARVYTCVALSDCVYIVVTRGGTEALTTVFSPSTPVFFQDDWLNWCVGRSGQ